MELKNIGHLFKHSEPEYLGKMDSIRVWTGLKVPKAKCLEDREDYININYYIL